MYLFAIYRVVLAIMTGSCNCFHPRGNTPIGETLKVGLRPTLNLSYSESFAAPPHGRFSTHSVSASECSGRWSLTMAAIGCWSCVARIALLRTVCNSRKRATVGWSCPAAGGALRVPSSPFGEVLTLYRLELVEEGSIYKVEPVHPWLTFGL